MLACWTVAPVVADLLPWRRAGVYHGQGGLAGLAAFLLIVP